MCKLERQLRSVKAVYIHKSWGWSNLACIACPEFEYYEALLRTFKLKQRLFPYHLAEAICGKLRVTPFRYYYDVIFQAMRNEMPYDKIPNFTAAEILQLLGIGRNEYIANLNACNEKKLLWRVNKGIAKEYLPSEPLPGKLLGWWRLHPVSISKLPACLL
jgi:FAM91 N-terminus